MANSKEQNLINNEEMSLWELISLLRKNWLIICIIITVVFSAGITYSFVIQDQGQITYRINKLVIYDDWDYYSPNIAYTYASELGAFLNEEVGVKIVSVSLDELRTEDKKVNYYLKLTYSTSVTKSEAEEIAQNIIGWHNSMIDSEAINVKMEEEERAEILYSEYENAVKEYFLYMDKIDMSSPDSLAVASTLESAKDISYEMWKDKKIQLQKLYDDISNASDYYISNLTVLSTVYSTWKTNIAFSLIFGLVISIVFILLRESYRGYKSS